MHVIGIGLYFVKLFGDGALLTLLSRRRAWRVMPLFVAWIAFGVAKSAVLAPKYLVGHMDGYSELAWPLRIMGGLLLMLACGELVNRYSAGIAAALAMGVASRCAFMLRDGDTLVAMGRAFWFFAVAAAVYALLFVREHAPLARGLLVAAMFPLVSETPAVMMFGAGLRYVPTASWCAALVMWMHGSPAQWSPRPMRSMVVFNSLTTFWRKMNMASAPSSAPIKNVSTGM